MRTDFSIGSTISIAALEANVHPILRRLREHEPIAWFPALDAWLVTRHDDAIAIMRDAKTFTVDHPGFSTAQVIGSSMLSLDGSEHARHRSPFEKPFRKSLVLNRLRDVIVAKANQLLEDMVGSHCAELRRDYAGPIAAHTMMVVLGIEQTPTATILGWYDAIVDAVTRISAGEGVSAAGRQAYTDLGECLAGALEQKPDATLFTLAGSLASNLSKAEVLANAAVLLFGGIETTEGMIANAFYHLLSNPTYIEPMLADNSLVPKIVEESLRLEPAASVVDRYTTRPVTLRGVEIGEGALLRVSLAGANRDPAVFADPDRFDPFRPNLRSHVTFAQGPHVCLGLHLARLEAHHALNLAFRHLPNLRLQNTNLAEPRGLIFRKSPALNVVWD